MTVESLTEGSRVAWRTGPGSPWALVTVTRVSPSQVQTSDGHRWQRKSGRMWGYQGDRGSCPVLVVDPDAGEATSQRDAAMLDGLDDELDVLTWERVELFLRDRHDFREGVSREAVDTRRREEQQGWAYLVDVLTRPEAEARYIAAPSRLDVGQALPGAHDAHQRANTKLKGGREAVAEVKARADAEGRVMVSPIYVVSLPAIRRAIAAHPEASKLLGPAAEARSGMTVRWSDRASELECAVSVPRLLLERRVAVEVLPCSHSAATQKTLVDWCRHGAHRKAAMVIDGVRAATGDGFSVALVGITVHAEHPRVFVKWCWRRAWAVSLGRLQYRAALEEIAECSRTGDWRDRDEKAVDAPYELPEWAAEAVELVGP